MSLRSTEPPGAGGDKRTLVRAFSTSAYDVVVVVLLIALPGIVYYLWFCLTFNDGELALPSVRMWETFPLPTAMSVGIFAGWLSCQALLQVYAPGKWVDGPPLPDGSRLRYKMNGWFCWWFTWAVLAAGVLTGVASPAGVAEHVGPLITTANLFAYVLCLYLYWRGKRSEVKPDEFGEGGAVRNFWLGTELNPRIGTFDLKLFLEARPGLMAWVVLDFAFAAKQYQLHGNISLAMLLVCTFQFWYVADYFRHEEAILSTWDIKHEKLGWMLCWGDLVWVPFTYTIQASYLVEHAHSLPIWGAAAIVLLNIVGYVVFRGANIQKHSFRQDPDRLIWGRPASYILTAHGSKLLTSGWWRLSRHMNYFGDLLMALAWCLPCLFGSPLPYFYVFYLTALLVHRERRDNASCEVRYGHQWQDYCAKVPYRIVPGIY